MSAMARYVSWFAAVGVAVPVAGFLLLLALHGLPTWIFATLLFLCPSYVLFAATAACAPFDACSLEVLGIVATLNLLIYSAIGLSFWFTRGRWRSFRIAVCGIAVIGSGWLLKTWFRGA